MSDSAEPQDPDVLRERMRGGWDDAAPGWGERADAIRDFGMPVSGWMIEQLALQPGYRVLELGAGPGDTGFLAAELIKPGGSLICSDSSEPMLEVARERAQALGIGNAEFRVLEMEWIDLPTAELDAVLSRWGLMLVLDPEACLRECRRVLKPGGRIALAVWDGPEVNPWATLPAQALAQGAEVEPEAPCGPGLFSLASPERLGELLEIAGFLDVVVEPIALERPVPSLESYLEETTSLSMTFRRGWERLSAPAQAATKRRLAELVAPYAEPDGSLRLPGRALGAAAGA